MTENTPFDAGQSPFTSVPIEITICVGKARPTVRDLLRLGPDSVLTLDKRIDDPVELYVGTRLIARGELVEAGDDAPGQLAVRLTEVADLRDNLDQG
ncbi:MAG: FliM/FliN family flagellar motor switch protein [Marinovum algicola]|jgi:flagellar motor switch protein FliN/FliY|uniref:Flagellar motor switch protein FliN n=1 Tax=Marinovum algicola TaxID=42444 RepID=A0A975ZNE2_9RHOB|nr:MULTISPECIES: FliM/FliN family flagellar motor switch protein [Marinovum]AKO98750.1 Flagellar motor switch/type III secretory pathway protein FliN [Marinovum algicola DG 898]MDD9743175.1 FliM/FliN family flagellar motor switch protein [Marinovum sp. PR37]SEJ47558.1 flagellar motor switch protein FliN/FliY [Marinovum algicola]SLN35177.1 Flagellar motor switch protein FliN [Marinovum algicola]